MCTICRMHSKERPAKSCISGNQHWRVRSTNQGTGWPLANKHLSQPHDAIVIYPSHDEAGSSNTTQQHTAAYSARHVLAFSFCLTPSRIVACLLVVSIFACNASKHSWCIQGAIPTEAKQSYEHTCWPHGGHKQSASMLLLDAVNLHAGVIS